MIKKLIAVLVSVPLVFGTTSMAMASETTKPAKSNSQSVSDVKKEKGKKAQAKQAAKKAANEDSGNTTDASESSKTKID